MKFSINDFFSKCDQISKKLRIWSHLLKKFLMENFIFCAVTPVQMCIPPEIQNKNRIVPQFFYCEYHLLILIFFRCLCLMPLFRIMPSSLSFFFNILSSQWLYVLFFKNWFVSYVLYTIFLLQLVIGFCYC